MWPFPSYGRVSRGRGLPRERTLASLRAGRGAPHDRGAVRRPVVDHHQRDVADLSARNAVLGMASSGASAGGSREARSSRVRRIPSLSAVAVAAGRLARPT